MRCSSWNGTCRPGRLRRPALIVDLCDPRSVDRRLRRRPRRGAGPHRGRIGKRGADLLEVGDRRDARLRHRRLLGDLNVAVDDLGGRASLVGLCQGGWLAAAYAARFFRKVARLVLAGAPIDTGAAESRIAQTLASVSTASISQALALSGGRVLGSLSHALWSNDLLQRFHRGSGAAMRRRSGADREVQRLERPNRRSARRLFPADGGVDIPREPAGARRISRSRADEPDSPASSRRRSSSSPRPTTRSWRFRKRRRSRRCAGARASKSASSRASICRSSWADERSRPPGRTSRAG